MTQHRQYETPMARVRGLGSAKSGAHHWLVERVTALAAVPLTLWFIWSIVQMTSFDHAAVSAWLGAPVNAFLMILSIVMIFYHAALGCQVIAEDYIGNHAVKLFNIACVYLILFAAGLACTIAILKIAFVG